VPCRRHAGMAVLKLSSLHKGPDAAYEGRASAAAKDYPASLSSSLHSPEKNVAPIYQVEEVESSLKPTLRERMSNVAGAIGDRKLLLLGTAGSWFILDVLFYGNSLFSADVTR
jgi:hypothetical protein